jgi:hypothetical protein
MSRQLQRLVLGFLQQLGLTPEQQSRLTQIAPYRAGAQQQPPPFFLPLFTEG